MSRPSSPAWRWSRSLSRAGEPLWAARMEERGGTNWLLIERPGRARLRLEVYFAGRGEAEALVPLWGGKVESVPKARYHQKPGAPLRIAPELEIVHEVPRRSAHANQLHIPYGMAFGSGEHATTLMLLRGLARWRDWPTTKLLDLGTGSGILALAARRLGARDIEAADFDPDSIRTARQNEALNFSAPLVGWKCADAKRLRSSGAYSLIVANLFSTILCEAAPRINRALRHGGQLWVSGVLRGQQAEVAAAYRGAGLRLVKTTTRGKWVMQQWGKENAIIRKRNKISV
jgi:ribosomal protein L11 methyltransferase